MKLLIAPYKMGSQGAKVLAQSIGAKRTKALKRFKRNSVIINWGRSNLNVLGWPRRVLNSPYTVSRATNKLECLDRLKTSGVQCVEHTTNPNDVMYWLADGAIVYGRSLLNASQGKGIHIIKSLEDIIICPLYTKGIIKSHEYRVHVFNKQVIDVTKKRRRSSTDHSDYIKNIHNGWVYCRNNIEIPDNLKQCALDANLPIVTGKHL